MVCVSVGLAGCGSSSTVDAGGFSAGDLTAASKALAVLAQTSVWNAAAEVTYTNGNLPKTCSFHIEREKPLTFKLFITWVHDPYNIGAAPNRRDAWLEAVVSPEGLSAGYLFHLGYAPTAKALASHYGDAYAKPAEKCLVEQNGTFALVSR